LDTDEGGGTDFLLYYSSARQQLNGRFRRPGALAPAGPPPALKTQEDAMLGTILKWKKENPDSKPSWNFESPKRKKKGEIERL